MKSRMISVSSFFRKGRALFFLLLLCLTQGASGAWAGDAPEAGQIRAYLTRLGEAAEGDLFRLYQNRDFKPAWNTGADADPASLNDFLDSAAAFATYHGLSEKDSALERIRSLTASKDEADAIRLEVLMTSWLLRLARALNGERVNLAQLYPGWTLSRGKKDIPLELGKAIAENRTQRFFDELSPKSLTYRRLADALAAYREREKTQGAWPRVSSGPTIKPGMRDARLAQVRGRLLAEGYVLQPPSTGQDPELYGDPLREDVIAYQARNGLQADGDIGAKTLQAMNVPIGKRIGQILANMERLRHIPDDFPARYARVNIADASIEVVEDGRAVYHAVVVLGRPDRRTPFIHSQIRSVIFNPSWTVPAKIAREDILPKLRKDPHYLEKMGMSLSGADTPHGSDIDWNAIKKSEFTFRLRQSPGEMNSLGRLKFDFDNDFSVYLHGTSHPDLFAKAERHLSSGCVRIKDPNLLAQLVLARNEGEWSQERVQTEIDKGKTRWMRVSAPLPLYLLYDTALFPTSESLINFREDVYGYDQLLLNALKEEQAKQQDIEEQYLHAALG